MPTLTFLIFLWIFLGYISSFVRRLHDLDLSGWWIGIPIILYQSHILGFVFINYNFLAIIALYILGLVIYCCKKGTDSTNKYGPIQTQSFEFFESIKKCPEDRIIYSVRQFLIPKFQAAAKEPFLLLIILQSLNK